MILWDWSAMKVTFRVTRRNHSHDHYQCDAQHFLLLASYHHRLSSVPFVYFSLKPCSRNLLILEEKILTMSGARGCFNCGGCALSLSSLSLPLSPSQFPNFRSSILVIYRDTSLFLPIGDAADDDLVFFSHFHHSLRNCCGRLSCRAGTNILISTLESDCCESIQTQISLMAMGMRMAYSRSPSGDVPQGRDADLVAILIF
jgi:hypothetical protein